MSKTEVPKQVLKQKHFHEHYVAESNTSIEDWVTSLIGRTDTLKELWKKELCWIYKLKTYALCDLKKREFYEAI